MAAIPLALPNRINCPVLLYAVLFCSGSRSNDRSAITRDSYFRWGIFACQPACLSLSLSQFVILSLFYFFVPSFIPPNTLFLSFCHCMVEEKQWISCEATYIKKVKVSKESREAKCFQCRWINSVFPVCVYWCSWLPRTK